MSPFDVPNPESAIAIVGMAARFPGAKNVDAFWQNLDEGKESVSFFSDEELEKAVIDPAELRNPGYVRAKAILEDIDLFDAAFFGFSPREAAMTDPQHRLFMECAWEALEHAGYDPEKFPGAIGVYAGAGANNYLLFNLASSGHLVGSINAFQALIHNKNDHLATRVAYKLNLRGPAVNVQTACSTSLVALHHACHSLLTYQSDICLAGGATISHPQNMGYLYHERGIGSPDGHCRTFDADAQGTVAGSGVGILVLKRYEDAVAEGDTIHAVVLSTAINNDGSMKVGYTAPSVDGQAEVIETALGLAGIDPASIGYVEAHGTATPMGDPIEVEALTRAYRASTQERGFCAIGSVKTNVGHLDTAAGVAGLIKTVEALKHAIIPASLHFQRPNPAIDFASSPFYVNAQRAEWRAAPATPRRAGVSSFGLGGTNAHAILQEAPARAPSGPSRRAHLLLLSAQTDAALEQANERLVSALQQQPDLSLADVAYTLQIGRKAHAHRRMVVCESMAEATSHLTALTPERVFSRVQEPCNRPLTFMFPGQGSQYVQMGRELYEQEARFREEMDRCLALLKPHMAGLDLRAILFPPAGEEEAATQALLQTHVTQPALFVIEYALAQLWLSWGVRPTAMIGHSVGEYVAACLAGVFSLEDALALVALRGRLIQSLPEGAMLSVPLAEKELLPFLNEELSLAAVNGPALCVVSGPTEAVAQLEARLSAQKVICRPLHTSHAFHSHMMEPILTQFAEAVRRVKRHAPQMPYLSNVTGTWISEAQATDPAYWARHIRQTVRFADGLAELLQEPDAVLLEVGPGRALRTIVRWHPHKKPNQFMLASLPHPQEKQSDITFLLTTIGHLWLAGIELDWANFYAQEQRHRLPLPTYPFQRQRYWIDLRPTRVTDGVALHEGLLEKKSDLSEWFYIPTWQESAQAMAANGKQSEEGTWLLFVTPEGPGARFASQLRAHGARVITVQPGSTFRQLGADAYEINPEQRGEYEALLAALKEQELTPARIVHFWSVASAARPVEKELALGFYALLYLAQALGTQRITTPVRLLVVSSNAQEVVGNDLLSPERATLFGPCMVIPREYQHVTCRSIDIAWPLPAAWQEEHLLEQLLWETTSPSIDPFVAYRGGRRWEKSFKPCHLDELPKATAGLREGGTYLITGGLGGLGIAFAEHLAQSVQANLVLVGRSAFPAREAWEEWLTTHEAGDATSRKIRQLREMESKGSLLLIATADVTDEAAMRQVVAAARERFGTIHGVIHAAGVPAGGLVQLKSAQEVARVMGPKVQGTRVLERLFADSPLDFLALCSSLTTAVGRLGQVDYTAANAFLDAFAHYHHSKTGTFTVALNWGAWDEVGMAAAPLEAQSATPTSAPEVIRYYPHPLLERCLVDTAERKVFATDYNVDKHWVLDEHRILGHPVIPGVAYFEMVRAALGALPSQKSVEFREVFFVSPLRVPDGQTREVRLVMEPKADEYSFAIRSQEGGREQSYTVGKVRLEDAEPLRQYDLAAIRERCNVKELLLPAEQREEDLGPRWHSVQRVHMGHNEVLLYLNLPEAFASDFEHMVFHPAILDRAAGIAKNFLASEDPYLPLTYNSLKIKGQLQPKIYSYARIRTDENSDRDTITFDIVLMDEEGRALVEIERFTQKRVNDPGAEIRALATGGRAVLSSPDLEPGGAVAHQEIRPAEGVEALQRVLAWRVMPQVVVSVRDLQASIAYTDVVVDERIQEARGRSGQAAERPKHPRPNLSVSYAAPRNEIERTIAEVWQEMLGVEQVGIHDNFFELGGDSLVGIEVVSKLSQLLNVEIPAVNLFEGPTVSALSQIVGQVASEGPATFEDSRSRGAKRRESLQNRRARKRE